MQSNINSLEKNEFYFLQIIHGSFFGPFIETARSTCATVKSLSSCNRIVTVFLYGEYNETIVERVGGDEIIFLNASKQDMKGNKRALIQKLKAKTSHHHYDLCIAHRSKPTRIGLKAFQCPVISVHHAYGDYQHFFKRLFLNLNRKRVTLVGVSDSVTNELKQRFKQWPTSQFHTLYNRIDIDKTQSQLLSRHSARQHLGITDDEWVIGHVGRLHPVKDQATLIQAFAKAKQKLPDKAKLVIIGNGKQEAALKTLASQLNIYQDVLFAGYQKQAKTLFKAFDCFALTSLEETFGMVLLEAMAADVPVIVSDCGGAIEVVGDCARIFAIGDVEGLSEALIQQFQLGEIASSEKVEKRLREKFSDEAAVTKFRDIVKVAMN